MEQMDEQTPETRPPGPRARECVLLVEDYEPNVLVTGQMIEILGYDYEVAWDGSEAVRKSQEKEFFVILMDVQMRGMDGLQATRQIRALEKEKGRRPVPIIAMTARATADDRELCALAGMTDYLSKPYRAEEFERKLNHYSALAKGQPG